MLIVIGVKGANGKQVFVFWTADSLLNLGYFHSRTVPSPYKVRKPLVTLQIKSSVLGLNSTILYNINFNFLKGGSAQLTFSKMCNITLIIKFLFW